MPWNGTYSVEARGGCRDAATGAAYPDATLASRVMPAMDTGAQPPPTLVVSPLAAVASAAFLSDPYPSLAQYEAKAAA